MWIARMKCPNCGHEMQGNKAKCLRCGYTVKDIVLIDPEKVEEEKEPREERKEIDPDDVHVSRAGSAGSIFGDLFGGGIFGGFGSIIDSIFGGFGGMGYDEPDGYEYDPKYYDDFGNEIYVPDEFERESVVIHDVEYLEGKQEQEKKEEEPKSENHARRDSERSRKREPHESDTAHRKHRPQDFLRKHKRRRDGK